MRGEPDVTTGTVLSSPYGRASGRSDTNPFQLPAITDSTPALLVVDDDPDCGELVSRAVNRHEGPFTVTQVRDGQSCLDMLDRQPYALVLLDYGLPRMNGLEVLRRIREAGLAVPVVMATGQGDERIAVEAMKLGAADYVVKSGRYFTTLPTVLAKVLRQHALAAENAWLSEEAARQQQQLAQIFDSTSDGIILVAGSARVLRLNRRAGEILGFDVEQAVNRPLAELLDGANADPANADGVRALLALLQAPGDGAHGELQFARSGRAVQWSGQPVVEGDCLVGLTLTFQDVTRERDVSRMKSDFVSFVAHQLRTPLSGIKWMLELAGGEGEVPPMVASCVRDASASADRLIGMVNDLLDIAKLESGSLTVTRSAVDLHALTGDVLDDLRSLTREKRLRVTVEAGDGLTPALADPQLLRQVVLNLISNAVRYTPADGVIEIRIHQDDTMLHWQVVDSGIGIPAKAHERLFEKFYRADNAVIVETEGTGLGLYLVRLIMQRLGGRVWFTSTEGAGATFGIALPRTRHP